MKTGAERVDGEFEHGLPRVLEGQQRAFQAAVDEWLACVNMSLGV